ncbi:hypothetical protein [Rhodopirellula europaea]|uniref:Uncharacterized protein n=1 Tax=Rhodopirellula europaea 6C TaxID=1263867 RepID=M2AW28_9BACT|nr:hypothetical protein [Rhodopirellula europaea]EMB14204.1 hypothetical protein RE6C_05065 [Rhodopirellula europaea 6C]
MTDSAFKLGSNLIANSVVISTDQQPNRFDGETELINQTYLRIYGSASGFRWLSALFAELADRACDEHPAGVVFAPDLTPGFTPVALNGWDKLDISCDPSVDNQDDK